MFWTNCALFVCLIYLFWRTAGIPALLFVLVVAFVVDFVAVQTSNVPIPLRRFAGINVGLFGGWIGGWLIGGDLNPSLREFALVPGALGVVNGRAITEVVVGRIVRRDKSRITENDPEMSGD